MSLLATSLVSTASFADTGTYQRPTTSSSTTTTSRSTTFQKKYTFDEKTYFHDNEVSVDMFGLYALPEGSGRLDDGFGGGLGVNYFFTRNIGLGVDGYWWDGDQVSKEVVSSFTGSLILRLPIDSIHLAPYVFGGGGAHFSGIDQLSLHGGAGLEYRLTPTFGLFGDGRYTFTEDTNDFGLIRVGARFVF